MTPLVVCAFVVIVALGYAVTIYNGLIRVRNGVKLTFMPFIAAAAVAADESGAAARQDPV